MPFRPSRKWALAGIVGAGFAALAVMWIATPACACVPPLTGSAREASIGSAARALAAAQEQLFARRGRYATNVGELADVALPPVARLAEARAEGPRYELILAPADSTGRRCRLSGGRTATDSVLPFQLSCSKP